MAKSSKKSLNSLGINLQELNNAFESFEKDYAMSKADVVNLLCDAIQTVVRKKHIEGLDDPKVEVTMDPVSGIIQIYNVKDIVEDVEDDELQISLEDALKIDPEAKIGGEIKFEVNFNSLPVSEVKKIGNIFMQRLKETQKNIVSEMYKDKIGEIINGSVESKNLNNLTVDIGKTKVTMNKHDLISDEITKFNVGDSIKVYLDKVGSGEQGIHITRTAPGFIKRLFEEEIRDVYDGTVVIKDIAREAGQRSKVSVYSQDFNVDPVGACIGQGGTKIQRICKQINNEKIDIIQYHDLKELFIAESLQPAKVIGVYYNEHENKYLAIVKNGDSGIAIGSHAVNVRLASKLTNSKIDIKEEKECGADLDYKTVEELTKLEEAMNSEKKKKALLEQLKIDEERRKKVLEEAETKEREALDEFIDEEDDTFEEVNEIKAEDNVQEANEVTEEVKAEEVTPAVEEKVEFNPVIMQKVSLEELEKQIEEEKKQKGNQTTKSRRKQEEHEEVKPSKEEEKFTPRKDIYTEEELAEMDEYEEDDDDSFYDDVDYDDYDQYYDDK